MNDPISSIFVIRDLRTGSEIISRLSLTNPQQAEVDLHRILDSLAATPPDGETYFQLLEQARLPISFVAEEMAKRYLNKPLPLAEVEEEIFSAGRHALVENRKGLCPLRGMRYSR